jgi:hypothetical protein
MNKKNKLKVLFEIIFLGFILGFSYSLFFFVNKSGPPKDSFLFSSGNNFGDLILPMLNIKNLVYYTPLATLIYLFFNIIGQNYSILFFLIFSISSYYSICMKEFIPKNIFQNIQVISIIFLSYPILFTLDRSNMEIFIFFLLYVFIQLYKNKKFNLAAIVLSLAVSLKIFPIVFASLFLSKKHIKPLLLTFVSTFLISGLSFLLLLPTYKSSSILLLKYLDFYRDYHYMYEIGNTGLFFSHSLFGLIKVINFYFFTRPNETFSNLLPNIFILAQAYSGLMLTISLTTFAYLKFIEKELWKKITLLVILIDLFALVSADYKLIHFLLPLFLFINVKNKNKTDIIYIILFGLLLIPKNYFILRKLPVISLALIANPIILLLLMLLIVLPGIYNYILESRKKKFTYLQ